MCKRQNYIDDISYTNTLKHYENSRADYAELLRQTQRHAHEHSNVLNSRATDAWEEFQLRYTAGEDLDALAQSLGNVVDVYDQYVKKNADVSDDDYLSPFMLDDMIDTYIKYIHLLCVSILLHREDLLPTIVGWLSDKEYDDVDAILEELLNFYFSNRSSPDSWIWKQPYEKLLDVIDASSEDRPKLMRKYVRSWCPAMKGQAYFWNAHTEIKPEFSPYFGYWAMCSGAFTYLLDIDDKSYRDEEVYPKDLVDYARSRPRSPVRLEAGIDVLRVEGGQVCPREGMWFSPAKNDSERYFKVGEIMPTFDSSEYGRTIWQWKPDV